MTKLDPAIIEAASCQTLAGKERGPKARASRVIRALADHMPEEAVEESAKLIAQWIGYKWEGLPDIDISDKYPDWAFDGIGTKTMQGGKPAIRKIVREALAAFLKRCGDME